MMKPRKLSLGVLLAATLAMGAHSVTSLAEEAVKGLRGADVSEPDEFKSGSFRNMPDGQSIPRNYVQQPPMVPHKIDGYEISLNFNRCMDCHSWSRYSETGATKVSLTHFKDRDGGELANISPRRYFCVQCHVPQTDAKPLIENTFERAGGLR